MNANRLMPVFDHRCRRLVLATALVCAPFVDAAPQNLAPSRQTPGRHTVDGKVELATPGGLRPVGATWVVLHRVGRDRSGPIDSMRTDATGRYAFAFTVPDSSEAVYFASSMRGGIAYFSQALTRPQIAGDDAAITVYDTTSAEIPLHVRGRHLVVSSATANGRRTVIEVFELSNDTTVTRVAGTRERATWSTPVPAPATEFESAATEMAAGTMTLRDGHVLVFAPFAPGLKQIAFTYTLPVDAFPMRVPITGGSTVFEVLLEDAAGMVRGAAKAETTSVTVEGRRFKRFLARDVPDTAVATISFPRARRAPPKPIIAIMLAVLGGIMMLALLIAIGRRPPPPSLASGDQSA